MSEPTAEPAASANSPAKSVFHSCTTTPELQAQSSRPASPANPALQPTAPATPSKLEPLPSTSDPEPKNAVPKPSPSPQETLISIQAATPQEQDQIDASLSRQLGSGQGDTLVPGLYSSHVQDVQFAGERPAGIESLKERLAEAQTEKRRKDSWELKESPLLPSLGSVSVVPEEAAGKQGGQSRLKETGLERKRKPHVGVDSGSNQSEFIQIVDPDKQGGEGGSEKKEEREKKGKKKEKKRLREWLKREWLKRKFPKWLCGSS
ncbi:hypothetical protein BJ508DRAFT_349375 [Ascobolus immersus RN42]|uniref:Uncharacterized protein n=1 Tax=Ascobolus immersus RN42 TaxID=1160509 RepID=A0A3N4HXR5_ASCIM|nr:hypothetical protein BJ508DRAFT_349375 [Ascobolus immersus RN42]